MKKFITVLTTTLILNSVIADKAFSIEVKTDNLNIYNKIAQVKTNQKIIAVADFVNDTGDNKFDYLQKALANSFVTSLASVPNNDLSVVERTQFEAVKKELGFSSTGYIDLNTATKIGNAVGATEIVVGGLARAGDILRLNVRVIDVKTAKVLYAFNEESSSEKDIFKLVDNLSLRISSRLLPNNPSNIATVQPIQTTQSINNPWGYSFLFPGIGQLMMNETTKGTLFAIGGVASLLTFGIAIVNHGGGSEEIAIGSGIAAVGIYTWSAIDSFYTGKSKTEVQAIQNNSKVYDSIVLKNNSINYQIKF